MPKRKREDDFNEALSRSRNEVHHAFKVAKGFERQRQSKRLHDPKTPADKKARIEKEVFVLKSLDLHQAAYAHLCSALLRIKSIAESPKLPAEIKAGIPKPEITEDEKTALHNVTSGLANRQEVRNATDNAIAEVCNALGIPVPEKKEKGKKEISVTGDKTSEKWGESRKDKKLEKGKAEKEGKLKKPKDAQESPEESDLNQEEQAISQLDDLLASPSGEEDSEKEGTKEGGEKKVFGEKAKARRDTDELDPMEITSEEADSASNSEFASESGSGSGSESEFEGFSDVAEDAVLEDAISEESDDEPEPIFRSPPSKKKKGVPSQPTGSTFLPSLMGGYISGSDTEASDVDIAPKSKNRRGQRARQAIWEKKYKAEAKHLKKKQQGRDAGWDLKRGAVDGGAGKPWKKGIRNPLVDNKGGDSGDGGDSRPPPQKRNDTGPLHPSWEAKRKAKEAQNASVPFQGKKIVFD